MTNSCKRGNPVIFEGCFKKLVDHHPSQVTVENGYVIVVLSCDRKLRQPAFLEESNQPVEPAARKQPIQLPKEESAPVSPPSPAAAPPSPPAAAAAEEEPEEELYDEASAPATQPPAAASLLSQALPRRPPSDDEENREEDYDNGEWSGEFFYAFVSKLLLILSDNN